MSGEIDAAGGEWRGVFEPWQDPSYFARVELDDDVRAIGWPNGADVAPETLHVWLTSATDRHSA